MEKGVKGMRFLTCPDLIDVDIDKPIADAFAATIEVLKELGAKVETVPCPFADQINPHRRAIADAEFYHVHEERYAGNPDGYGIRLQERIENAKKTTLAMYIEACNQREVLKRMMVELMRPYDAMLSPGYPCLAAPIDTTMATINGEEFDFIGLARNLTGVQNFFGFPGLSVPIGFDSASGLPMAMQITTLTGEEALGFRIGHAYEQAMPDIGKRQPAV
jgi:Asp-tRNA(Asn)/Glu-tRNA(Gln) amidotransferase A subunit family amidase